MNPLLVKTLTYLVDCKSYVNLQIVELKELHHHKEVQQVGLTLLFSNPQVYYLLIEDKTQANK